MTKADRNIATKALLHIEALNRYAIEAQKVGNDELRGKALRAAYTVHGKPFGPEVRAIDLWYRFRQATTGN